MLLLSDQVEAMFTSSPFATPATISEYVRLANEARALANLITNPPRPHPSVREDLSPPLGGGEFRIFSRQGGLVAATLVPHCLPEGRVAVQVSNLLLDGDCFAACARNDM